MKVHGSDLEVNPWMLVLVDHFGNEAIHSLSTFAGGKMHDSHEPREEEAEEEEQASHSNPLACKTFHPCAVQLLLLPWISLDLPWCTTIIEDIESLVHF